MKSKRRRRKSKPAARQGSLSAKKIRRVAELLDVALRQHQLGQTEKAAEGYRQVLEVDPGNARSLYHLGLIAHHNGDAQAAAVWIRRAVDADPRDASCWNNLGNIYRELGKLSQAIDAYQAAAALRPDYANAYYNLGLMMQKLGAARSAIDAFRQVLKLTPSDADTWNRLGSAQLDDGDPEAAKVSHFKALELEPASADAFNSLGLASMDAGEFEEAAGYYRKAIELAPGFTKVYLNLAKTRRFSSMDRTDLRLLESVLERRGLRNAEKVDLHFALGKALDDCAAYDEAFAHFEQANSLKRSTLTVDHRGFEAWITAIISTFDEDYFSARAGFGVRADKPVFIFGMPRSGTTLVEQIIASHPQAFGAGELPTIGELVRGLSEQANTGVGYPGYGSLLDEKMIHRAADSYLAFLSTRSASARRITDKLPGNYLYLGLIALMFPEAHVIDCRREPLDVLLSIFFSQFAGDHPFAYKLDDIAFEYRQYRRLVDHWERVLPISVHAVSYEELVANPGPTSREIIDACGLEWDEACLRFYEHPRPVHTASNWQVRQPIYGRSVGRWKHYEKYLGSVMSSPGVLDISQGPAREINA